MRVISSSTVEVLDGGRNSMVAGHDLLKRWWSWRHCVGEFTGTPAVGAALLSLSALEELLSVDQ
jgi:hypothetical protein